MNNNQGEKETDFIPCSVPPYKSKLAELCSNYLSKGKMAAVDGRIQVRSYDGQDGQKRWVTEVIAEDVRFLSPKDDQAGASVQNTQQPPAPSQSPYGQPPMGAPAPYGQQPYPGQYHPQQMQPPQAPPGYMPPPQGRAPGQQAPQPNPQQSFWMGDAPPNGAPASAPGHGVYGYQVPYNKDNIPF